MFLWGLWIDPLYLVLFIVTLVISGAAQLFIRSQFGRYSGVRNSAGLTGVQVGERLGRGIQFGGTPAGSPGLSFKIVPGDLSDHFDPRTKEIGLSEKVASRDSVAAMAVTAHEVGHAQQDAEGSVAMRARAFLVPAVTFSPTLSYILIFMGLIFNLTGLFWLGIVVFGLMVLFSVLTLPVEIGASRRALVMLRENGLIANEQDEQGVRRVLTAAAMTYVAAAVTSILTLLYYLSIARRS
jgi:Zn-dependent membrane protease YugP